VRQCKGCGARFYRGEEICPYCGTNLITGAPPSREPESEPQSRWDFTKAKEAFGSWQRKHRFHRPGPTYGHVPPGGPPPLRMFQTRRKEVILQAILSIFFGSLGAQWFYRGQIGRGILCLCFGWTGIPGLLGIIEGIGLLRQAWEDEYFLP